METTMNELMMLAEKFGTFTGLILFIAYKELPLILKKRSGKWIDLEDIKSSLEKHISIYDDHVSDDRNVQNLIARNLEVYQATQSQININLEKEMKNINDSMNKNFDILYNKIDRMNGHK